MKNRGRPKVEKKLELFHGLRLEPETIEKIKELYRRDVEEFKGINIKETDTIRRLIEYGLREIDRENNRPKKPY